MNRMESGCIVAAVLRATMELSNRSPKLQILHFPLKGSVSLGVSP